MLRVVFVALLVIAALGPPARAEEDGRPRPADWKAAVAVFRTAESYDEEATGAGGDKSDVYLAYEVFRDGAPLAEVRGLLGDTHPIVRSYAVRALAEKHEGDTKFYDLALSFLDDRQEVLTFSGCLGLNMMVGDVVVEVLHPKLDKSEQDRLLSRLLDTRSPLWFREKILRGSPLSEAWYDQVRVLAEEGDGAALIALARFGYAEDLPLVKKALSPAAKTLLREPDGLIAAHAYGGRDLLPRLTDLEAGMRREFAGTNPGRFRHYLGAVAAQGSRGAESLLLRIRATWTHDKDRRAKLIKRIAAAVEANGIDRFEGLLLALWDEDRVVSPAVVRHFHEERRGKAYPRMVRDLSERAEEVPYPVLDVELGAVAEGDPEKARKLLVAALTDHATLRNTAVLSRWAAEWKLPEAVGPLLKIVEGETNPHRYLRAAEALLCYGDEKIDVRLAACPDENKALSESWGGKRFAKLLRDKPRSWSGD